MPSGGVITRVTLQEKHSAGSLVASIRGDGELRKLLGADSRGALSLGPLIPIYHAPGPNEAAGGERQSYVFTHGPWNAIWDAFSASIIACDGHAVVRIVIVDDDSALVSLVAGSVEAAGAGDQRDDGQGAAARFRDFGNMNHLASDGCGHIYVSNVKRIRKVQLPASMRAEAAGRSAPPTASSTAALTAVVTTLPFEAASTIQGLAYVPSHNGGSLLYATYTALYRVPLLGDGSTAPAPQLVAGLEDEGRVVDGSGTETHFHCIQPGLAVDADGCILVVVSLEENTGGVLRVAPDGAVTMIATGFEDAPARPTILPNGYLLTSDIGNNQLLVLDLGLRPPPLRLPVAAPTGPPPRTLPTDLGALLDAQPDGTSDLTVVVGELSFHVHRGILSARCDYFKAEGTFADGSTAQLSLLDVDPAAFALLLRFLYTGTADIPAALACAVAELADRLLLPELCAAAQAQVLASAAPATVVGSLLWAAGCEARGPGFSQLVSDLKAWYVERQSEVLEEAGDSVMRLAECPRLMMELMKASVTERGAKRQRTR